MGKTKQPRKQKRALANLKLHQKRKKLSAILSKELRKKFNRRTLPIRRGDRVRVLTGSFKGVEGEVMNVDLGKMKVYIDKVVSKKRDGTEVLRAMEASNLMITDVDIRDKARQKVLERKVSKSVIETEIRREETRLKKAEEERKKKEAEMKAREEEKKAEKERKEEAKTAGKKKVRISEKGIDKKTKKEWISEK